MKNFYLFFLFFVIVISCNMDQKKVPIQEDMMVNVLTDLYFVEAYFESLSGNLKDSMIAVKKLEVLAKYGLTDSIFNEAGKYYSRNDKLMEQIENKVVEQVDKLIKADSLKQKN